MKSTPKETSLILGNIPLSTSDYVELYICGTPLGEAILKKISIIRKISAGAWTRSIDALIPEDDSHKTILAEAIASQDFIKLDIKFINTKEKAPSYLLKGWKKSDGKSFVTISAFDASKKSPLKVINRDTASDPNFRGFNEAIYGFLKDGGARDKKRECNKNSRSKIFKTDTVDLKLDYCYLGNHAIYISYDFKSLSLLDKNTGEAITVNGHDEILKTLTVVYTHHSLLDQFIIKSTKGVYTIESGKFRYSYLDNKFPSNILAMECDYVYNCGADAPAVTAPGF